jgi:hypothetical protein
MAERSALVSAPFCILRIMYFFSVGMGSVINGASVSAWEKVVVVSFNYRLGALGIRQNFVVKKVTFAC